MLKGGLKIKFDLSSIVDNLSNEEVEDLKKVINQANKEILRFQDDNPESIGMGDNYDCYYDR